MQSITLYKAAEEVRNLLEQVDPETGELPAELEPAQDLVANQSQAVIAWILSNDAEADFVEEHAKKMFAKAKVARKQSEHWRTYLVRHMKIADITEIKSDDGTFKAKLQIGRDESVDVFDETQLNEGFMKTKMTLTPDKTLISLAIKSGQEVAGARIVKKDRLTIK